MTPHHHWVQNYSPLCTPIRLADNSIIYSSGVGTVVFSLHKGIEIHIDSHQMDFSRAGRRYFSHAIWSLTAAFIVGGSTQCSDPHLEPPPYIYSQGHDSSWGLVQVQTWCISSSHLGIPLYMSSFRRTSRNLFNLTWRNVFSWVIQVDTKVGCSTIPTHRSKSSLNVQSLMNTSFLACPSTRQHHQLILHHLTLFLSQLVWHLTLCSIWGG